MQGCVISNQVYQEAYSCTWIREHPTTSHFLAQSNGNYIAIFSSNPPFKLNKYKRFEGHFVSGFHVKFDISPDGSLIYSGSANGQIYLYNWNTAALIRTLTPTNSSSPVIDVECHPLLPSTIASCDWQGNVIVWNWIKIDIVNLEKKRSTITSVVIENSKKRSFPLFSFFFRFWLFEAWSLW